MIPNTHRVIIKPIELSELKSSGLIIAGQLKAGENLFYGLIEHPGTTKFVRGQGVFYSEYSAASLIDARAILSGERSFSDISKDGFVVVAEDDIMAYYPDDSAPLPTTS